MRSAKSEQVSQSKLPALSIDPIFEWEFWYLNAIQQKEMNWAADRADRAAAIVAAIILAADQSVSWFTEKLKSVVVDPT